MNVKCKIYISRYMEKSVPERQGKRSSASKTSLTDLERAELCAEILKAVAHPLRLRIVATLCEGEQHVNGLSELLDAKQSIVSQQLKILRMHELVRVRRQNGHALYSLAEPHLEVLVSCMGQCVAERCADRGTARRKHG
jgi:DNA-binding transcriptional ArsR family regulator